ncbi:MULTISPECIES: DUF190 domain-containing protein [unclassified Acinetobacter]|uniref:DUF190 domain-containing protein n=1 Tax=unclassified Acinetobacter TaxID=196816 RepID=UPI0024480384|nr:MULTISPECIES: DUF190 domain-containing protein [unclassified Acinetobacter]MDH0030284.1 DUF190 domain-containing protein [Acinetobacter sp. GD04021]MDH0885852.1 DUF190 domain-containing protein [Acinetobacter sp. GD03873]MDH1082472.1 DUF190 domain-containing protein [Acinetobacter sp. GD03983]MDH2189136.1 DUF190 domain-containing protein [Acinetobacter sp. GD03645]MDH2202324.1 DUF190 domain-containing protein [Acinetobacter sp. GD03647]
MKGYLLKFYLEENENYKGKPLYDWLLEVAKTIGLKGATVNNGIQSFDRQGKPHSAHFFELADRPVQIEFIVDIEQEQSLFATLSQENISIFYSKTSIEFGSVGNKENNND